MAQLSIFLLGPYHVTNGEQSQVHFEYDKVRALLAYLAVESDRPLRREFLAGFLWPEQPEGAALNSLRQAILKLRQAIGDVGPQPPILDVSRESIQINPHSEYTLDVREFTTLLEKTRRHQHRNPQTCPSCAEHCAQAVMLYRGAFLDQLSLRDSPEFESWIVIKREQLRNLFLQALTTLTDFHLRRQEYNLAQNYAFQQIETDPLREAAYRQMMIIMALDGKRTAALKCYEACRSLLEKELDIEPEEETEKLYQLIKAGLFKDHYKDVKSDHSSLPLPPSPFFGREKELAGVSALLENPHTRLITLIGLGGVGKTSLALKAASEYEKLFTHGACFVPLAQLDSANDIYRAIAVVLNISLQGNLDHKTQLLNYLAHREMLIILDNFEHLLPAGTEEVHELLFAARQVVVILTTTTRINSAFEYIFPIMGLDYPTVETSEENESFSAVNLFVHHALQNGVSLQEQDLLWINQICRLFEGNPLAIVLAASLLRSLSCSEVAKGIEEGIDLLSTNLYDIPERQKSFRSLYDYAWNHLTEKEQSQFRKLSVFRGGFQREAAQQVADVSLSDLAGLIDKSFLRKNQANRYRVHRLLQQYAYQKLEQSNETHQTLYRHLVYFVEFAEQASLGLNQTQQGSWLKLLDQEMGNLQVAFKTAQAGGEACAEFALRLAGALGRYWEQRGYWREGQEWLNIALGMGEKNASIPVDVKVKALFWAGVLASYLGENNKVDELAHRGLTLCLQDPLLHNQAPMLILLGGLKRNDGDYSSAQKLFQESLKLFQRVDDPWGICISLNNLFRIDYRRNAYKEATALAQQSLALAKETGDQWNIAHALDFLGIVAHDQGRYEQGKTFLNESLEISRSIGARFMMGHAIYWLGRIARSQANPELATILFGESLAHYREIGGKWGIAVSLQGQGITAYDEGDYPRAEKLLLDSLSVLQEVGDTQLLAYVKIHLGDVAVALQKYDRAISLYQESLSALIEIEDRWLIALAIGGLASVATSQSEFFRAAILFGIETEIRNRIGTPRSPAENLVFNRSICILRDQISAVQLHSLRSEGKHIARNASADVIEYVLNTGREN
jgi:predicted ATPase/DNA-binding SARP family transcriptional activator